MLLSVERFSEIYIVLKITGVRVPTSVRVMGSVPGAVATGSLLIARIDIAGIVTRLLPLPVLIALPKSRYSNASQSRIRYFHGRASNCGSTQDPCVANRIATRIRLRLNATKMRNHIPLTAAIISLTFAFSSCTNDGQPTEAINNPTRSISPSPLNGAANTNQNPAIDSEPVLLKGPNAVPKDTRIIVNIPAFRMDVFRDGALLKSYKIGIGYQQFPLPTGFRKAETIIFNPTWTQPNESWASNPGLVVPAGAGGNPLGPIKVPIGGANLIHGGKSLAKIGTYASHGCVGLTNDQVKDFAKILAEASHTELSAEIMAAYLKRPTRTQVVKLKQLVPVELRYETIVVED